MANFIKDLKAALKGSEKNFTTGSIDRAIFLLAVPMILEMLMESLFAVVDAYFVSNYVGINGVATVGLTESVITLIYATAIGMSMAATAVVARRVGEGNHKAAAISAMQAIIISSSISIVLGVLGFIFAPDILRFMGADEQVIAEGAQYTRILFGSNIVIMLLFLLNGIFRGAGDANIAMRSLWIANILNIILDPCFILGWGPFPEMGLTGAAVATTIGRGCGVAYQITMLSSKKSIIQINWETFTIRWDIIKQILKIGFNGVLQFLISSASWIFLMRIMAGFGSSAVAGYTIAIRIIIFTILPAWGMANAAATLVGQNLGAKKPDRAEQSVWKAARYTVIFLTLIAILFFFFAKNLIGFFLEDPAAVKEGVNSLRIICFGYLFFGYGMVIAQSFNGAGDTWTPTKINLIAFWALQIPLAYIFAYQLEWNTNGVYWAIAISESVLALISIYLFRKGKWKLMQV